MRRSERARATGDLAAKDWPLVIQKMGVLNQPIPNKIRTAETKRKIFEATVLCLNTYGYAGTTMQKIAQAAGVTRGAVQHVYGDKKVDLMGAIAIDLYGEYEGFYEPLIQKREGPRTLLNEIWDLNIRLFKEPKTTALIELWLGMRGDEDLRRILEPYFIRTDKRLARRWEKELAGAGLRPKQIQTIRYTQRALLRGLAIERLMHADDTTLDAVMDMARRTTLALLKQAD